MSLPALSLRPVLRDALQIVGNAPDTFEGESYGYAYAIVGGKPPYTVTVLSGALPPNLTLAGTSIPLNGTATLTGTVADNPP